MLPSTPADPDLVRALEAICGADHVSAGDADRMAYARDMWPRSLIRQRAGAFDHPPEVVVWPGSAEEVAAVVKAAVGAGRCTVPFGAGSGVCGGTLPVRGGVVLDLKRLNRILDLVESDCVAHVEAGAIGEILERELNRRGWTLGHFPSSIYCSTLGGWLAGRSAGQCSSRFGKIEDMLRKLTWVDADGRLCETPFAPPGFAPWSADPLIVGSEGTLGIICSAWMVIRPLSAKRRYTAWILPDVEAGIDCMRSVMRAGLRPSVLRLYDEFDTLVAGSDPAVDEPGSSLLGGLAEKASAPAKALFHLGLARVLQMPRLLNRAADLLPGGCLLVAVFEGEDWERDLSADLLAEICAGRDGKDQGEGPARHWWHHRYSISYKQSPVFMDGAFVDTMEVAATWDRLPAMYRKVRQALAPLAFVMAHFSHAYSEGGSIYFTFAGAASDDAAALGVYDRIWDAAQAAVSAERGVVSHHHGVGLSKARYLVRQLGEAGSLVCAVKRAFDPHGRLNPGKLGLEEMDP
ncbi:MAG: FAD-binding oxidoreductase [Deltaproteobacteria bacterium]|nr:FAD-binding oxidoreductase [Deltaproteobacteria bacterium]